MAAVGYGNPHHGGYHDSEARVIVYEDANFRGGSFTLYPGEEMRNLQYERFDNGKRMNDRISSVRVIGGASIVMFDHHDMNGQAIRVTSEVRNLAHHDMPDFTIPWNDRISSVVVRGERRRPAPTKRVESPRHEDAPRPRDVSRHAESPRPGKSSQQTETEIKHAYEETLRRPADPDGLAYYRGLVIEQGWTDRMVRDHLRRSDEYRRDTADRMIGQAYRDVLARAPDPEGLANYRRLMLKQKWSEQQVRQALRSSPEYHDKQRVARAH